MMDLQLLHNKRHTLVPQNLVYPYECGGPESKVFSVPQGKLAK